MAKHKRPKLRIFGRAGEPAAPDARQAGMTSYQSGRFDAAIASWSVPAQSDPAVQSALAEAYFRRALVQPEEEQRLSDLRRAVALAPAEARFHYHLALALHRRHELQAAIDAYADALQRDPTFPGAALLLALATLEQQPTADLTALPGSCDAVRAQLAPVQALLRDQPPAVTGDGPVERLWQGLGLIRRGDGSARAALEDNRPLPGARAGAIRRYYRGVAAAQAGDLEAAVSAWQHVSGERFAQPWFQRNLAVALVQDQAAVSPDELLAAGAAAQRLFQTVAGNAALAGATVGKLDETAHQAAERGDWARAASLWEKARELLGAAAGLGSPRVLLHNLALAYEALERWDEAAEAWRAMLRTRPRAARAPGAVPSPGDYSDAQWAWIRNRVIECYRRAGTPGEAVTLFRQALKKDPRDLDTRMQLAEALLANEQEQAALNELHRILEIDPDHVDARLRLVGLYGLRGDWHLALQFARDLHASLPEREDVRRALTSLLLQQGTQLQSYGSYAAALAAFEEGRQVAPTDWHFPLYMARVHIDQRQTARARPLLEQTEQLAGDDVEAYTFLIEAWAALGEVKEVQALVARAEAALTLTADFYIEAGKVVLARLQPQRSRKATARDQTLVAVAVELLDRAVARDPESVEVRLQIARAIMLSRADLALGYAMAAVQRAPESPEALIVLGTVQGLNEQAREAKQTLRNAARLARRQGDRAQAEEADELARAVDTPFFRLGFEMQHMADLFDIPEEMLDDLNMDDIFG